VSCNVYREKAGWVHSANVQRRLLRPPATEQPHDLVVLREGALAWLVSRANTHCRRLCAGGGMEEWFAEGSRQDRLLYRSVLYASAGVQPPAALNSAIRRLSDAAAIVAAGGAHARASFQHGQGGGGAEAVWDAQDREVAVIHERYSPAPQAGALLQRRFELASSLVQLEVQAPPGEDGQPGAPITLTCGERAALPAHTHGCLACMPLAVTGGCCRLADLGGCVLEHGAGPPAERGSEGPGGEEWPGQSAGEAQRRGCAALCAASAAAQAAARAAEEETRAILASRQRQEQGMQLVGTAFYDATRVKVGQGGPTGCVCAMHRHEQGTAGAQPCMLLRCPPMGGPTPCRWRTATGWGWARWRRRTHGTSCAPSCQPRVSGVWSGGRWRGGAELSRRVWPGTASQTTTCGPNSPSWLLLKTAPPQLELGSSPHHLVLGEHQTVVSAPQVHVT
jgi:hypothetical protein